MVWISTTSPQSTCHSASVSEILSKSDHSRQKKMTSCRFSRWRISAILDFRDPITDSLKSPCTSPYRSSIETIALNCEVFAKIAFFAFWRQTDRQKNRRTDGQHQCRSCYREQRLNNACVRDNCWITSEKQAVWPPGSADTVCPRPPLTLTSDRLTLKLTCESNLPSKFGHARPLGSRIIRHVRDGQTDGQMGGRTDKRNAYCPLSYRRGIIRDASDRHTQL